MLSWLHFGEAQPVRAPGLNQRTRDFLLIMAQLAIIAYVFQILAVDHWFYDPYHAVAESEIHVQHCHGDVSGCSDGIGSAPTSAMGDIIALPSPKLPTLAANVDAVDSPPEAFIATPYEPPRAA